MTKAPLSTVKSRLYRGLAALKPQMEQLRASRPFAEAGHERRTRQVPHAGPRRICASWIVWCECYGAGVGGQSHASRGAGAGEDNGGAAKPGTQPVDSVGGLFLSSGDYLHGSLECVGCLRRDAEWRAGCEQSVLVLCLWFLPVSMALLAVVLFQRARKREAAQ